jgi:hypothetical protein
MGMRHAGPDRIVFDPMIGSRELRVLRAADGVRAAVTAPARHVRHRADRILACYLLTAAGALAAAEALPGVPWAWAWFLAAVTAAVAAAAGAALFIGLRYRGRFVNPAGMDPVSRQVLARAQAAISDVLAARIHREGHLDIAAAAVLDAREWEVARLLGTASRLAAALDGDPSGAAGHSQDAILRQARAAALRQTEDIEGYARQVKAADDAYRAHRAAASPGDLDAGFLDLLAATTAGDHGSGEVRRLRAEAAAAEQVFGAA